MGGVERVAALIAPPLCRRVATRHDRIASALLFVAQQGQINHCRFFGTETLHFYSVPQGKAACYYPPTGVVAKKTRASRINDRQKTLYNTIYLANSAGVLL